MDIQKNQTQESFEKLYVKNAPDWSLERDQDGGYKYHATQSAFLLFEQQQVEIDLLKAELAKAQAVPEGFVLIKNYTKTVVAIERMVEQQVEASGMDSRRLERLDGWRIIEAAIEAQEPTND